MALALALWAVVGLFGRIAHADVTVPPPPGWNTGAKAHQEARERARALGARANMRVAAVMSPGVADDFAETLTVLEAAGVVALGDDASARAELQRIVGTVVDAGGATAEEVAVIPVGDTVVVRGRWQIGELMYRAALVPWGPNHSVVVMVTRAAEDSLYRMAFTEALAGMTGVSAPVAPFSRDTWRLWSLAVWILLAGGIYGIVVVTADRSGDHIPNGRRTAVALLLLSLVGGGVAYAVLADEIAALQLAGLSREWVAMEVAAIGVAAAVGVLVLSMVLGRSRVIASAPTGGLYSRGGTRATARLYDSSGVELVKVPSADTSEQDSPAPPEEAPAQGTPAAEQPAVSVPPPAPGGPPVGVIELPDTQEVEDVEDVLEQIADEVGDVSQTNKLGKPAEDEVTRVAHVPSPPPAADEEATVVRPAPTSSDDDATVVRQAPQRPSPRGHRASEYQITPQRRERPWRDNEE